MAKFCSECGKELEDNNTCKNCGKIAEETLVNNSTLNQSIQNESKKTNGFAIAGFVISLVSIFCCGGFSWLSLIFSIIGLVNANKYTKEGKGLAIAGIVISSILLIMLIFLYSIGIIASLTDDLGQELNSTYY